MELLAESDAPQPLAQACFLCAKSDFSLFDAAGSELLIFKAFFMQVSDACQTRTSALELIYLVVPSTAMAQLLHTSRERRIRCIIFCYNVCIHLSLHIPLIYSSCRWTIWSIRFVLRAGTMLNYWPNFVRLSAKDTARRDASGRVS